jgi:anti-anti-sigma factor
MMAANEITLNINGNVTILDIRGDVTAFSEPILNEYYNIVKEQGAKRLLLRFETTAYINSGGIAVVVQILAQTRRNNQKIGITGLSDHFAKVFNMVGITRFATIYPTLQDALLALDSV